METKNNPVERESMIRKFQAYLRTKDFKITKQRLELAAWIINKEDHFTADDVALAFMHNRSVSKATIYRSLSLLVEGGFLEEQDFGEGFRTYEVIFRKQHHDHLICEICHEVIEFQSESIEHLQEKIAKERGYQLRYHTLKMYGICSKCQKKSK